MTPEMTVSPLYIRARYIRTPYLTSKLLLFLRSFPFITMHTQDFEFLFDQSPHDNSPRKRAPLLLYVYVTVFPLRQMYMLYVKIYLHEHNNNAACGTLAETNSIGFIYPSELMLVA